MPQSTSEVQQGQQYTRAWDALSAMLNAGKSWSGHERNCAFLNTRDGQFADVSMISHFDLPADSRGLAWTDWDRDGDLDVWISNRTDPALQFLRNDLAGTSSFLSLKLIGTTCNRDGIGARVEVVTNLSTPRLVKSLRAGEGYLSQSSKWLHFGLPTEVRVDSVRVHWPGKDVETFSGVEANRRYRLRQGTGRAEEVDPPAPPMALNSTTTERPPESSAARVVTHAPLPLPSLLYLDDSGKEVVLQGGSKPIVLNLWATWCAPCLQELNHWKSERESLAGVRVLCLSADDPEKAPAARLQDLAPHLQRLALPFEAGLATETLLESLDAVQRSVLSLQEPLPLPCTFLLDSELRLLAFYKGPVAPGTLTRDAESLGETSPLTRRGLAVPFKGRWNTKPLPPDLLAIPEKLLALGKPAEVRSYLDRHLSRDGLVNDTDLAVANPPAKVADLYFRTSRMLGQDSRFAEAEAALQTAWRFDPGRPDVANLLGTVFWANGRFNEAIELYRSAIEANPEERTFPNRLALLLARHPDPAKRDTGAAIRLAEALCEKTRHRDPEALATLATCQAAAGQFPKAVATVEQAIEVAQESGNADAASQLKALLQAFRAGTLPAQQ